MKDIIKEIHRYDAYIILNAIDAAKKSDMNNKHGCVIIDNKGKIISTAFNRSLNITKAQFQNFNNNTKISYHAEENALRNVDHKKLCGAKLYVIRYGIHNANPLLMNSKPCSKCKVIIEKYMKHFGLKVAYYSTNDTKIY